MVKIFMGFINYFVVPGIIVIVAAALFSFIWSLDEDPEFIKKCQAACGPHPIDTSNGRCLCNEGLTYKEIN